jgi:hypothetical protein
MVPRSYVVRPMTVNHWPQSAAGALIFVNWSDHKALTLEAALEDSEIRRITQVLFGR